MNCTVDNDHMSVSMHQLQQCVICIVWMTARRGHNCSGCCRNEFTIITRLHRITAHQESAINKRATTLNTHHSITIDHSLTKGCRGHESRKILTAAVFSATFLSLSIAVSV